MDSNLRREIIVDNYQNPVNRKKIDDKSFVDACVVSDSCIDNITLYVKFNGDIIEDNYEIDESAEEFIVPKLILQPLVENSIYHGIRLKGERGLISIKAYVEERQQEDELVKELHIFVTDTGVGMDEATIKRILSIDKKDRPKEADESFGLWGTIERIRMYTGMEDCVKIESETGEFTRIEIVIPSQV